MIERGSEIVNRIADDGSPFRPERSFDPKCENSIAGLRLNLAIDCISVSLPNDNIGFQVTDVLVGPFGFESDLLNSLHGSESVADSLRDIKG
jgi:hypothetical protein